jgi:hypothetical protein
VHQKFFKTITQQKQDLDYNKYFQKVFTI